MPVPSRLPGTLVIVFYLHGFASSAKSTKARWFGERFTAHAVDFRCPDFNEPDFATSTISRMLAQLGDALARVDDRVVLMGSSLGGTLAILAAAQCRSKVDKLVLMAPAVMFAKPGHHLLTPDRIDEWRRRGATSFWHYAYNEDRPLNYAFYEDSLRHDAFATVFDQPALVFQGLRDASVDHRTVEAFARTRPNVTLSLLDDDHQLIASLPRMWDGIADFLGLQA